jgi:hypothetical protein
MSSGVGQVYSSAYSPSAANDFSRWPDLSALEGIKEKLQHMSERSTIPGENEGDMIAASGLADDLRDAIVEYQVGTGTKKRLPGSPLMPLTVLATDDNLQAQL